MQTEASCANCTALFDLSRDDHVGKTMLDNIHVPKELALHGGGTVPNQFLNLTVGTPNASLVGGNKSDTCLGGVTITSCLK